MSGLPARAVRFLNPPALFDAKSHGYSHVADVPLGARLVFTAGQSGHRVDGHLSMEFKSQLKQALKNVSTALSAAGAVLSHVVRTTVYVVNYDQELLGLVVAEVKACWAAPQPPLNLIPVPRLALDGMLVEIEVIAAVFPSVSESESSEAS